MTEVKFHFSTITTLERRGDVTAARQAATLAKRPLDELHVGPTTRADESRVWCSRLFPAVLTHLRVEKAQAGFKRTIYDGGKVKRHESGGQWVKSA
jgi:hypothetical protein